MAKKKKEYLQNKEQTTLQFEKILARVMDQVKTQLSQSTHLPPVGVEGSQNQENISQNDSVLEDAYSSNPIV